MLALESLSPGSAHLRAVGFAMAAEETGWNFVQQQGFARVSKAIEFDHRRRLFGHPPQVVWGRLGNGTTAQREALWRTGQAERLVFDHDAHASFRALA